MTKFMTEDVPKYLGFVDKMIGQFGKDGHAVSNSVSFPIYSYSFVYSL